MFQHHHHHSESHEDEKQKMSRTSFSGSFMENTMNVSINDIRSASNVQLNHLKELIEKELYHRSLAKPYFIVEKSINHLLVEEAIAIEDEEIPRYIRRHHSGEVFKFTINNDSIFHQTPEIGQIFEIYTRGGEGHIVDVARRVATHG